MTSFRITVLAVALPLLVSCGATTPEGYPMVKGTYGGSQMYQTHVTDLGTGSVSTGGACSGTCRANGDRSAGERRRPEPVASVRREARPMPALS
jgi:hypothetical protein